MSRVAGDSDLELPELAARVADLHRRSAEALEAKWSGVPTDGEEERFDRVVTELGIARDNFLRRAADRFFSDLTGRLIELGQQAKACEDADTRQHYSDVVEATWREIADRARRIEQPTGLERASAVRASPGEARWTALHEAAHAVAFTLAGGSVDSAYLKTERRDDGSVALAGGACRSIDSLDSLPVSGDVAGIAALELSGMSRKEARYRSSGDLKRARRKAGSGFDEGAAVAKAKDLLRHNWKAVEEIADMIMEAGRVPGSLVRSMVRRYKGQGRPTPRRRKRERWMQGPGCDVAISSLSPAEPAGGRPSRQRPRRRAPNRW